MTGKTTQMTIASEIVKKAYREGNLIAAGTEPNTIQATEGLAFLNEFIDSLFGFELGEFSMDWPVPPSPTAPVLANYPLLPRSNSLPSDVWPYPPGNVRLILALTANTTIYLPQSPVDGERFAIINVGDATTYNLTVNANGRLIKGSATMTDTPGNLAGQVLFYDASQANWKLISVLEATSESPFQLCYDTFLSLGTLKRLVGGYGRSIRPEQVDTFKRLERRMKSQYRQVMPKPSQSPQPFTQPSPNRRGGTYSGGTLY